MMPDINELTLDEAAEVDLSNLEEVETPDIFEEALPLPEKAYLDTERGVFVCRNGAEFGFKPISFLVIERLMNDHTGKPKVPYVDVVIAGKYRKKEANPKDPEYLNALAAWETEVKMRLFRYLFSKGLVVDVPPDFVQESREFFPEVSTNQIQYLWVCECLGEDEDDIAALSDAIMGQTMPTQSGLEDAARKF